MSFIVLNGTPLACFLVKTNKWIDRRTAPQTTSAIIKYTPGFVGWQLPIAHEQMFVLGRGEEMVQAFVVGSHPHGAICIFGK